MTLDPTKSSTAAYLRGTVYWHIDGAQDDVPSKATTLSAHVISATGGETEFASTYAAYEDLSDAEKDACEELRVVHSFEASQRLVYPDPTPEQLAGWRAKPDKEHPLVWRHRSGRRSLVIGASASQVIGMDHDEGKALLDDLLERATAPERVYRHEWARGRPGHLGQHGRDAPGDPTTPRRAARCTARP